MRCMMIGVDFVKLESALDAKFAMSACRLVSMR